MAHRVLDRLIATMRRLAGWRRDLAAAGLGVLAAAALPPVHAIPVLLISLPGLLILLAQARSLPVALRIGFAFGFGHHLVGLYWITEAVLIEAARFWWLVPFAVPAIAAILACFIAVPCALATLAPRGPRRALALCGAWVLADLLRQFFATGFPWNPLGSVWAAPSDLGALMLQPAAVVGVHGLTLATLLLAVTPMIGRRAMATGVVGLGLWGGFGAWRMAQPAPPAPGISVLLVQGNVPQGEDWSRDFAVGVFRRYLDMTRAAVADAGGTASVVVWPETAFYPFLLEHDPGARAAIYDAATGPALIGGMRVNPQGRPLNSLMAVVGPGPITAAYDKWHLVPFGEYAPAWLPLQIMLGMGSGFAPGAGPKTLHVPGLPPVGALICYEAIFPGQIVDPADRPDWLVNVTNDAWFGDSTGPRQHLAAARLRAIEEGLPLMRAANTGISVGFDAFGRELGRLGLNVAGRLILPLPGPLPPPPFARFGLWIPAALALACLCLGWIGRRRRPEIDF